ncbi:hypothetical protein GALMADRAFT_1273850 [Galerina marginata CBS 339.88]|uniref:Uncharacterized protein n=1 Tax=Galerina marginata (strain CBS 339.88) TaxID=685588 RepID=A0A067T6N9_GALM3|nr:hypothetical protein GALMADRAFT_1273850 [Galerina marginata CBS 339.88]
MERLARSLYSLKSAIDFLPLSHTRDDELGITVDIPHIFEIYQSFDNMGAYLNLQIIRLLKGGRHFSVLEAQAWGVPSDVHPGGQMQEGNCVAKLVYGPYGEDVHKALAPKFAPKLFGISSKPGINAKVYIVEYMPPPKGKQGGWSTLSSLDPVLPRGRLEDIRTVLDQITQLLKSHEFVHGDLHPDNLMIKMESQTIIAQPVEIKILNFELAGVAGTTRYPLDHADRATDLIGVDDGTNMIDKWVHEIQSMFWFGPSHRSSAGVGVEPSSVGVYYPTLSRA